MSILISSDAVHMLIASSGAFFTVGYQAYQQGKPEAPSKQELQALQNAIQEGLRAVDMQPSETLQRILSIVID